MIRNKKAEAEIIALFIVVMVVLASIFVIAAVSDSEPRHVVNPYYHSENDTMECWFFYGYVGYPGYLYGYYPYGYYPIGWIWVDNYIPMIMWMSCAGIINPMYYPSVLSGQYTDSRYVPSYFPSNPSSEWSPVEPYTPSSGGSGGSDWGWSDPSDPGGWDGGSDGGWDDPSDPGGWDGGGWDDGGGWSDPSDPGGWDGGGWDGGDSGGGDWSDPGDSGGW